MNVTDHDRAEVARALAVARAHPIPLEDMPRKMEMDSDSVVTLMVAGDDRRIELQVRFSFEWQRPTPRREVLFRHLSVSLMPGKLPSRDDVAQLIKLFGFVNELDGCIWIIIPCTHNMNAINVYEPDGGDWFGLLRPPNPESVWPR